MYALLFALMSSTAPNSDQVTPAPAASTVKKVCRDIEVPMSRMKRRVCQKVVVKQPAPATGGAESADGATKEPAGE